MTVDPNPATESSNEPARPAAETPKGPVRRALEWVWQGAALADLQVKHRLAVPRALELSRRAKLCIELGRNAFDPPQPFESGSAQAPACELYRQAVYWGLLARKARAEPAAAPVRTASEAESMPEPATVWASADRALLASRIEDENVRAWVDESLSARSFADLAELPAERLEALAEGLRTFAESLLGEFDAAQLEIERAWLRRFVRLGVVAAALVALVFAVGALRESAERSRDVARGKPWLASSRYGETGCRSPLQKCPESQGYFFHTSEDPEPWLEIDLEQVHEISGVQVTNREDCCSERALPLVMSVSKDHLRWTEVARSTKEFKAWKASFPPVGARWVKLHVPHPALLHLSEVRVLR